VPARSLMQKLIRQESINTITASHPTSAKLSDDRRQHRLAAARHHSHDSKAAPALGLLLVLVLAIHQPAKGTTPSDVIDGIDFDAAAAAISERRVAKLLGKHGKRLAKSERRAAALLVAMNVVSAEELAAPNLEKILNNWRKALIHKDFQGSLGELALIDRLALPLDYTDLLAEEQLLGVLADGLTKGLLTGYDLRRKDVYGGFTPGHTLIYSHSSPLHLQQLATLLSAYGIEARMYVTPKVSAFLFREGWGEPGQNVRTLPGGTRVLNGRELAVLFEFSSAKTRAEFHSLILRYAKKDQQDEAGLIANSWWQPFYYSDRPLDGFPSISLVIVSSDSHEATLTVLHEREDSVVAAVSERGFPVRVEKVWVNPAFFRFLKGDFR